MSEVTVAIPVRNGGELLTRTLRALSRQTVAHELLVCDSGSTDGSAQLARSHGARVLAIDPAEFGHGRTRNLLMSNSRSARVALITQDAEPADELWLESLLAGLDLAADVAIAFGPYLFGVAYDVWGDYKVPFLMAGVGLTALCGLLMLLPRFEPETEHG